ncbi:SAUR-like auxin-responsive protein family [Perilla frutescens var. frutescens]|nr:SAUR-like auxin-responsive protein family [Perilla frutescens var. frutescens]
MSNTTKPRIQSMFDLAYDRVEGGKLKKSSSILKKLERYLSIKRRKKKSSVMSKSKSWSGGEGRRKAAPTGCFPVYVGPEKQRFVMKAEFANHPLFKMLLEDAELEYGFSSDGPLLLPCHVDLFCKVLAEMECDDDDGGGGGGGGVIDYHFPCGLSPARRPFGRGSEMSKGPSYGLLTPLRSLKIG